VYFATVKTLALVHFVYFAVKAGAAQRFAGLMGNNDKSGLAAFARETVQWTFWPSLAMGLALLVFGKLLLSLFGESFTAGYPLLFVLVAGVVARASVGPAESLLSMSGNQNACAAVYGLTLALNIALNFWLIPVYGLAGAAISTTIAMLFESLALAIVIRRRLGIVMFVFAPRDGRAA
ncbi:MAG TPA: polysaccharide biosynthesis C-terminal domain-containing protein, partial [Rhizobiaceae bacterium]|nr:polysaccharide biosynthesis C-terminal domain-containing protein [Rhizobiaceae bacterium]